MPYYQSRGAQAYMNMRNCGGAFRHFMLIKI